MRAGAESRSQAIMANETVSAKQPRGLSVFEKYLTVWVVLCIVGGIVLGKIAPGVAKTLDGVAIRVGGAPVVSVPIAVCLFFMMYPIMVKIDFAEVIKAGKSIQPVALTLFVNWAVKPFTMFAIALLFLGAIFHGFIGPGEVDYVKMPFGLDLPVGAAHGAGTVVMHNGAKMLQVPLWRSYLAGCILLGIAPCTAMVLVWGYLAKGNDGHTLVMVAINSLTMLLLYGVLGGWLLGVGRLPVPWQALLLSIAIYVALPLAAGYLSRKSIIAVKGEAVPPDEPDLLACLRPGEAAEARLPGRGPLRHDRRLKPLRGRHRHGYDAVRAVFRGGARDGRRGPDRGAGDADAREDLPANAGMVPSPRRGAS